MLINTLKDYGFSEKEAKVYLACLELGNAIVSSVARRAGEHRITTYSILKDLKNRGIAQELTKNKVKYFSVISPEHLLENEEKKVEKLKEVMPELLAISNAFGNKPKVYFYEGYEGLKEVYLDQLKYGKKGLLSITGVSSVDDKFKDFLNNEYLPERIKKDIFAKVIVMSDDASKEYSKMDNESLRESIFIKNKYFKTESDINIYAGNRVSISMYNKDEISGLIIESKSFHETFKGFFDLIWDLKQKYED